ncbi:MAG: hydrogenase maturation nickel metallochaperone HypA [Desulfobacteraceae bacterium]|nr:MAG: hydrogenase maturation nickel metallochaperone HypA [Desulfobacteraceae bacterium]
MHEMSIAQSLFDIIREEMTRHNAHTLSVVRLRVGEMSAIVPDSLSFCFEVITAGTGMEGARLDIEIVPVEGTCRACGKRFKIEDYRFLCPSCGGTGIDAVSGQELSIVEIEVDD